jgi:hypothetical protein
MPPLTSQQRFQQTISGQDVRPPLFPEGLREGVLQGWRSQGFLRRKKLDSIFHYDAFEELDIATDLRLTYKDWPTDWQGLRELRQRLDPEDPRWLPKGWAQKVKRWSGRDYPLFLVVHDGLFLTLGISDGASFSTAMLTLCKNRGYVEELLALQAEFEGGLAARLLREMHFDAAIFSEPIASHQGTLISPKMYAELVLPSYDPLLQTLRESGVQTIIWRSYANPRLLLPAVFSEERFDCLWACETNPAEMDYLAIRQDLGDQFSLMGGIDVDWLYGEPSLIRERLEGTVTPLLEQGRYIPLADGRVREGVPYPNYVTYREALEAIVGVS